MKLRALLIVLVCLALSVVGSVLPIVLHLRAARPDLLLSVVLYLALNDEIVPGAILSALAGYVSDLTSTTPPFLYTFLAVLTFVVLRVAGSAVRTEGGVQSAAIAFAASLVHSLVATLLFGFFAGAGFNLQVGAYLWTAFGTALAAPAVFSVLRRLDARLLRAEGAQVARAFR